MEKEIVINIQKYIKDKIDHPLTLSEIAKEVHYSSYYISRIFKKHTGMSIFEFIRKMRLTSSAKMLRDHKDIKIIDVAFDFFFDSHEGFTRAFSKEFDITPKAYQKSPIPMRYFMPYLIEKEQKGERKRMDTQTIFVQIIERPKRKAIIKRGVEATEYFQYCEEVGCDIFGVLTSIKEAINEPMGMWLSDALRKEGTSTYVQGVEVPLDYKGVIPEGYEIITLEETKMLVFQGEPYDDENFRDEVSKVMASVKKYNPEVLGYQYDEQGYRFQYAPEGYRGYIEGRTIKKL